MISKADYLGGNKGCVIDKSTVMESIQGEVLNVPIPLESPWSYELEVARSIMLYDNSELFICKIHNILGDERLADKNVPIAERMKIASPVMTANQTYFSLNPLPLGIWGQ
jgi:hypothetical protein